MLTTQSYLSNRLILFFTLLFIASGFLFWSATPFVYGQTGITISAGAQERNQILITVTAPNANQVAISSFIGEGVTARALLGQAQRAPSGVWQYTWNVTGVAPGTYRIFAIVFQGTARTETPAISVRVGVSDDTNGTNPPPANTLLLPPIPTITSTTTKEDPTIANELDALAEIVDNLDAVVENEEASAIVRAEEAIDATVNTLPDSVSSEREAIKNDLSLFITETQQAVRDSVLSGGDSLGEAIQNTFEQERERYLTRLREIAQRSNTTINIESLRNTLTETFNTIVEGARKTEEAFKNRGGLLLYVDSDRDGVSDYDEQNIYRTNPRVADSDSDGVSDSDELLAGTNPLSAGNSQIIYADPNTTGVITKAFKITGVAVVETQVVNGITTAKKIRFEGRAFPNGFVTLFIFSSPIVVTVKANTEGLWSYVLDKELPDGSHTMYVAAVDTTGKILAKSQPVPFVKQADAVTLTSFETTVAPASLVSINSLIVIIVIVLVLGILALMYISHQHKKKEEEIRKLGGTTF